MQNLSLRLKAYLNNKLYFCYANWMPRILFSPALIIRRKFFFLYRNVTDVTDSFFICTVSLHDVFDTIALINEYDEHLAYICKMAKRLKSLRLCDEARNDRQSQLDRMVDDLFNRINRIRKRGNAVQKERRRKQGRQDTERSKRREDRRKKGTYKKRTTPRVPTWSPTAVLTGPDEV